MSHSCIENYLHIIFSTKNREPLIVPEIEARLHSYIVGISKRQKVPVIKINGMEDHVHILLKLHPSVALATLIKEFKVYSTAWMKRSGYPGFAWQEGYGGFSYSKSMLDPVIHYIENQKHHHRQISFKDELELLKKKWGVEWDV